MGCVIVEAPLRAGNVETKRCSQSVVPSMSIRAAVFWERRSDGPCEGSDGYHD